MAQSRAGTDSDWSPPEDRLGRDRTGHEAWANTDQVRTGLVKHASQSKTGHVEAGPIPVRPRTVTRQRELLPSNQSEDFHSFLALKASMHSNLRQLRLNLTCLPCRILWIQKCKRD